MDTGLRRYDASYYKPPLVMLGYDTARQGDFFKEQIASVCAQRSRDKKRKEQLNINYKTRHSREGGNPLRRRHFYAVPAGQ